MINLLLQHILSEYNTETENPLKDNALASKMRHDIPEAFIKLGSITDAYKVQGSVGQGQWAEIPWIGFFDKEITNSASSGYYIVYLFEANMQGVYLSLNQGWMQYEDLYGIKVGRERIQKTTEKLQADLTSTLTDFSYNPINLGAKNNLGRAYELGHICGKYYPASSLPNDRHLIDDLRNILGVYRELKGAVHKDIMEAETRLLHKNNMHVEDLSEVVEFEELKLKKIKPKIKKKYLSSKIILFDEEKTRLQQIRNKEVGDIGEKIVFDHERTHLRLGGRDDLADMVKIVGEDMSLGFDVLSFDLSGKEKQIEVKSSLTIDRCSFYLSSNELQKSKYLNNYYLYIVHGIGTPHIRIQYVKNPDFSSDKFHLEPRGYLVDYSSQN